MKKVTLILLCLLTNDLFSMINNHSLNWGCSFNIGKRNYGLGINSYCRYKKIELNTGFGGTFYNGVKLNLGAKYYIFQGHKFNPFLVFNFSKAPKNVVKDDNSPPKEAYNVSANKYLTFGGGFYVKFKDFGEHHFSLGYTEIINNYNIIPFATNTEKKMYPLIRNATKGGLMLNYSMYFRLY